MPGTSAPITHLRSLLRAARRHVGRPWLLASRFYRGFRYGFDLIIWSRIARGRRRLSGIEMPATILAKKAVRHPPPRLEVADHPAAEVFGTGFAEVYALLFANLQRPGVLSAFRHALPGPAFRGVYLWDSAFIAQVWKCWEPAVARDVLQSVVELRDGDRLQHVVSEFVQSQYTQPPLVAWSVVEAARWCEEAERAELFAAVYPALRGYHRWLASHRRLANGLYAWKHPYESGVENAPRFGSRDEKHYRDTRAVGAPDLCAYVVLQLRALASMAETLGQRTEAAEWSEAADALAQRVEAELWHEEDGVYYDREADTGAFIRSRTIASLLPLWAGIPSPERARRLCAAAMDPADFGTRLPLPSVSRRDPEFEKDMWRGPVWINTAYGGVQGLLRYGFEREAGELAFRLCEGVYAVFAEERQVYEFYDPDAWHTRDLNRKKGNRWKAFTLGTGPQKDFVGWSGLVNTLLIEVLFGLSIADGQLVLRPRFPAAAQGACFTLELPGRALCVSLRPSASGACQGVLRRDRESVAFSTEPGGSFSAPLHSDPLSPCATAT